MKPTEVNLTIFNSIPLNKDFKKFFLKYYLRMVNNNGEAYAADRLKEIKEACIRYRSEPNRLNCNQKKAPSSYFMNLLKKKSMIRELIKHLEATPHLVLDMLKIYIRPAGKPIMSKSVAAKKQSQLLEKAEDIFENPMITILSHFLKLFEEMPRSEYLRIRREAKHMVHSSAGSVSYRKAFGLLWSKVIQRRLMTNHVTRHHCRHGVPGELVNWYVRWNRILHPYLTGKKGSDLTITQSSYSQFPQPAMYADFNESQKTSLSYQKDLVKTLLLSSLCKRVDTGYKSDRDSKVYWNIFFEYLSQAMPKGDQSVQKYWFSLNPDEKQQLRDEFERTTNIFKIASTYQWVSLNFIDKSMSELSVDELLSYWPGEKPDWQRIAFGMFGEIQYIPKKGTVKWRPIAVPNRFIQFVLRPLQDELRALLSEMPRDCTFNQDKCDKLIISTLNTGGYVGSVDLKQATDHMPYSWIEPLLSRMCKTWNQDIRNSYTAFNLVSRGFWFNEGMPSRWTVGQPLGTAPSFNILGLTHNLILETLSVYLGKFNSPYCVLGDDVIMLSSKLRDKYLEVMKLAGIPISEGKSYQHLAVEFAGKIFIKNQPVLYCTDPLAVGYNNLFDYSRATGIPLKWKNLPSRLKKKIEQQFNLILSDDKVNSLRKEVVTYYTPEGYKISEKSKSSLNRIVDLMFQLVSLDKWRKSGRQPRPSQIDLIRGDPRESEVLLAILESLSEPDNPAPITTSLEDNLYVKTLDKLQNTSCSLKPANQPDNHHQDRDICLETNGGSGFAWVDYGRRPRRSKGKDQWKNDFRRRPVRVLKERFNRHSRELIVRSELSKRNQKWFRDKYAPYTTSQLLKFGSIIADLEVAR